jgi:hypothetical protein
MLQFEGMNKTYYQLKAKEGADCQWDENDIKDTLDAAQIKIIGKPVVDYCRSYTFATDGDLDPGLMADVVDLLRPYGEFELKKTPK